MLMKSERKKSSQEVQQCAYK